MSGSRCLSSPARTAPRCIEGRRKTSGEWREKWREKATGRVRYGRNEGAGARGFVRAIVYDRRSVATSLLVIGSVLELGGIVALGFPDLLPGALRVSTWLGRQWRLASNRLRRLVGLKPRAVVHTVDMAGAVSLAGHISAVVSTSNVGSLEEKVEYLLRRDQDAQRRVNEHDERLDRIEAESTERLAELRGQMETHIARELGAALEAYRPLRVAGTVALVIGLGCVTAATLLA